MIEFEVFREESVFDVEEGGYERFFVYLEELMKHAHPFYSTQSNSLDKLYFFQDLWFLIQFGAQYVEVLTDRDVALKNVRVAFLAYCATLDELEMVQTLSEQERFIFCYRYLMKLFNYSRKRMNEETALTGIREAYYGALHQVNDTEALQQIVIERYYSEWFKQGYLLTKLFQEKLFEVKKIWITLQDVYNLDVQNPLVNGAHFVQAVMRADDLLEIAFWKIKFTEQGVQKLFDTDRQARSTIVICAQQSEAIRPVVNMQIGLIFAILLIGKRDGRDCVYIPYAERLGKELYCEKGHVTTAHYLEVVQQFLGGDDVPSYRQLLNMAFIMLKLSATSTSGDIILICNEQIQQVIPQDEQWQRAVQQHKEERNIRIVVLYSGTYSPELSIWFADRIIFLEQLQTELGKDVKR